jgi:hypothetical protein
MRIFRSLASTASTASYSTLRRNPRMPDSKINETAPLPADKAGSTGPETQKPKMQEPVIKSIGPLSSDEAKWTELKKIEVCHLIWGDHIVPVTPHMWSCLD